MAVLFCYSEQAENISANLDNRQTLLRLFRNRYEQYAVLSEG